MTCFKMPVDNPRVTSHYNPSRKHPNTGKIQKHAGVDLINTKLSKAPIYSAADGTVRLIKDMGTEGYGKYIIISHNTGGQLYETVYAHLDSFQVVQGQSVKQGQRIATMGKTGIGTGVHLHFEIHRGKYDYGNGAYPKSFDPWPWINPNQYKMRVSAAGITLIKKWEGFRADAYKDSVGVWTIGYGLTKWPNGAAVKKGETITETEASILLEQQVNEHASAIFDYVKIDLTQNQFDALASFCYNLGKHILKKDPALTRYINAKDWPNVTRVMQLYNKAGGKALQGLVNRRIDEVELFKKGVTPMPMYKKDEKPSEWAENARKWVIANGISDGTYAKRPATREEVWVMVHSLFKLLNK